MCEFCKIRPFNAINCSWMNQESGMVSYEVGGKTKYGYLDACPDPFYSGIVIRDMKYCPMCGRELDEE